jgi:hypothetical protein
LLKARRATTKARLNGKRAHSSEGRSHSSQKDFVVDEVIAEVKLGPRQEARARVWILAIQKPTIVPRKRNTKTRCVDGKGQVHEVDFVNGRASTQV